MKEVVALCLQKDPADRPSADKLLQHKFFKVGACLVAQLGVVLCLGEAGVMLCTRCGVTQLGGSTLGSAFLTLSHPPNTPPPLRPPPPFPLCSKPKAGNTCASTSWPTCRTCRSG
jgi:hypothetical protein